MNIAEGRHGISHRTLVGGLPAPLTWSDPMPEPTAATAPPVSVVTVEVMVRIKALALQEADGRYPVVVPAIPGCVTQGDTLEDVQANVVEVSELMLNHLHDLSRDEAVRSMLP